MTPTIITIPPADPTAIPIIAPRLRGFGLVLPE